MSASTYPALNAVNPQKIPDTGLANSGFIVGVPGTGASATFGRGPDGTIGIEFGNDTEIERAGAGVVQMPTIQTLAANEATTATAGGGAAPPATVQGYVIFQDHTGTARKIPYYAN